MVRKKETGIVLVIVLGFVLLFAIVATSFILVSSSEIKLLRSQNNSTRAFYIAEAGLERARYDLQEDADWSDGDINSFTYLNITTEGFDIVNYDSTTKTAFGGEFTVWLKDIAGESDEIWVKSKGTYNNAIRIIMAKVKSSRRFSGIRVDYAIETQGNINISGNAEINPPPDEGGTNTNAILNFEGTFGVTKEEMETIAADYFSGTYYQTTFNNDLASTAVGDPTLTWVSAPGTESQITINNWTGAGILVVDGNLKITGGTFTGILWVIGTLTISGNPTINGGIFVESGVTVDTEITGTATINMGTPSNIENAILPLTSLPPTIESWQEVAN